MRMRNILLLTIIHLVTLLILGANGGAIKNCLIPHEINSCSCCKSGYRGPTCSDVCQHCLTRDVPGGECTYYCETGYYGKTCDKECPHTCADGNNGPHLCEENDGLPVCVECILGFYGKQCDQTCDTHCHRRKCYKTDGGCLNCSTNVFYGDHCRQICNQGCVSRICNRTGHCTQGCTSGFYGEQCMSKCGINCKNETCSSVGYKGYTCTEGCNDGYMGTPCLVKCPNGCTKCDRESGECELQVEKPEKWAHIKEGKPPLVILVISGIVVVILICIFIVIWKKRRQCRGILRGLRWRSMF